MILVYVFCRLLLFPTKHYECNIAFACNNNVIETVKEFMPTLERVYIWSDGCASQFRSQYVFRSLLYYPDKLKITWDYGEAHHDGIGGTVKRKVYQDVSTWNVVIKDALHFATYANEICNVQVEYLDKGDIPNLDLSDPKYIDGTLQVHHVDRIGNSLMFYYNSNYKKSAEILKVVSYGDEPIDVDDNTCDMLTKSLSVRILQMYTKKRVRR